MFRGTELIMKPVIQEEATGCGIAAVAAIAGIAYAEARTVANQMGIHADNSALWSDTASVCRLLERFGCTADVSPTL